MPQVTIDDIYKEELTKEIRRITGEPDLNINFKTAVIGQHAGSDKQAKSVVVNATNSSSIRLNEGQLNNTGIDYIFNNVSLSTSYSSVLGTMDHAISIGTGSNL